MLKVKTYKHMQIHYVNGVYKYDIYANGAWISSTNTLHEAKASINNLRRIFT